MRTYGTLTTSAARALYRREKRRAERRHEKQDRAWVKASVNDFVDSIMRQVAPFPRTPAGRKPAAP